jgi:hypothetical protein
MADKAGQQGHEAGHGGSGEQPNPPPQPNRPDVPGAPPTPTDEPPPVPVQAPPPPRSPQTVRPATISDKTSSPTNLGQARLLEKAARLWHSCSVEEPEP